MQLLGYSTFDQGSINARICRPLMMCLSYALSLTVSTDCACCPAATPAILMLLSGAAMTCLHLLRHTTWSHTPSATLLAFRPTSPLLLSSFCPLSLPLFCPLSARRGYDVFAFAQAGAAPAVGLDLSPEAVAAAAAERDSQLAHSPEVAARVELVAGSFFEYVHASGRPFDVGFDYTFLW